MAVNINVVSQFDSKGIDKARTELDRLAAHTQTTTQKMMSGAQIAGAAILGGGIAVAGALVAIGTQFDDAFDRIRIGTGATGDVLAGLQGDFKAVAAAVPTSFADAGVAVTELNRRLGLSGEPLQTMSEQVLELSRITKTDLTGNLAAVSQVMQNFGVSAGDQSGKLDTLFRASQQSGISVQDLATQMSGAGVVLRDLGMGFDESAALLASLGKAGIDVGDVMPALSKSLAVAAKQGKSSSEVFAETFAAIKGAPNDVAASGVALEVFGAKAGPKLAAMIREGKLSYEDMAKAIGNGDSILQAGKDTQDFGEKLTTLKNRVFLAIEPIATRVFNAIGDVVDKVGPKIEQFTKWMTEHGAVLKVVAGIITGVVVVALGYYVAGMVSAAAATIAATWPILAVVAVIAALVAAVIYAWNNWDWFRDAVTKAWEAIKNAALWAWNNVLKPTWDAIYWYITNILVPYFKILWATAKEVFEKVAGIVEWAWNNVIQPYWQAISWYIENILVPYFKIWWAIASEVFKNIAEALSNAWNNVIKPVWDKVYWYITEILIPYFQMVWTVVSAVFGAVGGYIGWVWETFISPAFEAIKTGIGILANVFGSIKDAVVSAFTGIWNLIVDPVKNAINWIIDKWNALEFQVPKVTAFGMTIGGFTVGTPDIDRFHSGGMFRAPTVGGEGLALLQDGEMILTAQQQKQSGVSMAAPINVVINTVAGDPAAIERVVVDAIGRAYVRGMTQLKP